MSEGAFSILSDDVVLHILDKLDDDPRDWLRISSISTKFSSLIRNVCFKNKCLKLIPTFDSPPGGWTSLYKLFFCCPGLLQSGIDVENSGLSPDDWFDIFWDESETMSDEICTSLTPHLASGVWNLSREVSDKSILSQFKGDELYICDWPGCVHIEKKRKYVLVRGVFANFKQSQLWRTICGGNLKRTDFNCAFCASERMWDWYLSYRFSTSFTFYRAYVCENGHVSGAKIEWHSHD